MQVLVIYSGSYDPYSRFDCRPILIVPDIGENR